MPRRHRAQFYLSIAINSNKKAHERKVQTLTELPGDTVEQVKRTMGSEEEAAMVLHRRERIVAGQHGGKSW